MVTLKSLFQSIFLIFILAILSSNNTKPKVVQKAKCLPCDTLTNHIKNKKFAEFNIVYARHENNSLIKSELLPLKKLLIENIYSELIADNVRFIDYDSFFLKFPQPSKCKEGQLNNLGINIILKHLNLNRYLVGLTDTCSIDPISSINCQKAAMMMEANNQLSHSPDKNWKCFSKENYAIANSSNLSLGHSFYDAIAGQINDAGSGNFQVGHRRWILNPNNNLFGIGATKNAFVLKVFGFNNTNYKSVKKEICYPSKDFFPVELIPERWSFSKENVDFNKGYSVTVLENNKKLKVSLEKIVNGFALPTIVFIPQTNLKKGNIYKIKISPTNLKTSSNNIISYEYQFECI